MKYTIIGAAAIAAGAIVAGPVAAEQLTAAHGFVPTHTATTNGVEPWLACVTEATNGEVTFDHYPSGQISGHKESMDSLTNGLADVSVVVPGYETGKLPLSNMAMLPGFGSTAAEMEAGYREMIENGSPIVDEWTRHGVQPILAIFTPAYQLLGMGEPLTSMEALKGQKIRAGGGTAILAVSSVGAVPVEMAAPDMFVGLQRGTVDATILSLTSAPPYGLTDIVKSISSNGSFGSGLAVLAMNKETYDALPEAHRAAVDKCGHDVEMAAAAQADEDNDALKEEFAAKGITMYEFPEDVLAEISTRLATVAEDYVAKLEERGVEGARETYEMYVDALN